MMKLLPILLSLVIATPALASFVFSPNVGYYSQEREETAPASGGEFTELRLDARIGYILPHGSLCWWYVCFNKHGRWHRW